MKNLEFKNGFETISYDDLKLSLDEKMVSGKSINGMKKIEGILESYNNDELIVRMESGNN